MLVFLSFIVFVLSGLFIYARWKNRTVPVFGAAVAKRFLLSRAQWRHSHGSWRDLWYAWKTAGLFLLVILTHSYEESFALAHNGVTRLNLTHHQRHERTRNRLFWTTVPVFLIIALLVNMLGYGFGGVFKSRAASQITHSVYADWALGTADHDIDYRSGDVRLRSSTTITHETQLDFESGEAFTTDVDINPGAVQPRQAVNDLWAEHGVRIGDDENNNPTQIAADEDGGAFVAYEMGGDVFVQHVASDSSSWPVSTPVSTFASGRQEPVIGYVATAGLQVAFTVWQDDRNADQDLYGQVVDLDGNRLFGVDLVVSTDCLQVENVQMAISSSMESALVVYEDYRLGAGRDIYGSLVNFGGDPLDIPIAILANDQAIPQVITDDTGDYFVAWQDESDGDLHVYAQKINKSGLPLWAPGGVLVADVNAAADVDDIDRYLRIASDGEGGLYVAWQRKVGELSGGGPFGGDKVDLYVQRLDSDGDVASGWPAADGVRVNELNGYNAEILTDGEGGAFVVWLDSRFILPVIYSQRLNADGTLAWAEKVFTGTMLQLGGGDGVRLAADGEGGFFAIWKSVANDGFALGGGDEANVYIQRISADGLIYFQPYGDNLVDQTDYESQDFNIGSASDGGAIVVWNDERAGAWGVYGQKVITDTVYQTESVFISPVLELSSPEDWEIVEFEGANLDDVTIETRTSDNLSIGAVATASSYLFTQAEPADADYYGFDLLPSYANDGFETMYSPAHMSAWISSWQSGVCGAPAENQWIEIDFDEPKTVGYAILKSATVIFPTAPEDYRIQTWDGSAWEDQVVVAGNIAVDLEHEFFPVTTEKVRFYVDTLGVLQILGATEFELYSDEEDVWSDWEALSPDGEIMSPKKRLLQYRITMDIPEDTPPADLPQITTIIAGSETTYVPGDQPEYLSSVLDAGSTSYGTTWENLSMDVDLPVGANVEVYTRSGNTATAGGATWSVWEEVDGEEIVSPAGRYMQYKLVLSTTDIMNTPSVDSVTVSYTPEEGEGEEISECNLNITLPGTSACFSDDSYGEFNAGAIYQTDGESSPGSVVLKHKLSENWTAEGVQLSDDTPEALRVMADGAGGAFVVWRDGDNIYAQKIDESGVDLGERADICIEGSSQENPQIVPYDAGGAVISWEDGRNGNKEIYINVMEADGDVLIADGMQVATASYSMENHRIARDTDNNTYLYWQGNDAGTNKLMVQKYAEDGTPLWTAGGVELVATADNIESHEFLLDGENVFVAWSQEDAGDLNIYARKLDEDGNFIAGWDDAAGAVVTDEAEDQEKVKIAADNDGGLYVVWEDSRDAGTSGRDVYLLRMDEDGEPAAGWPDDGITVVASIADQIDPQVAVRDGEAVVAWVDNRNNEYFGAATASFPYVMAQKFGTDGTVLWDARGVYVTYDGGGLEEFFLLADEDGGATVFTVQNLMGNSDLFVQRITAAGLYDLYYSPSWVTDDDDQVYLTAVYDDGAYYVVWRDERSGNGGAYAQKLTFDQYRADGTFYSRYFDAGEQFAWTALNATVSGLVDFRTRTRGELSENLALLPGATATADSENTLSYIVASASNAVNGVYELSEANTFDLYRFPWQADPDDAFPHWLEVDLGGEQTVAGVAIHSFAHPVLGRQVKFYPVDYQVQTWDDDVGDWVDQVTQTSNNDEARVHNFSAPVTTDKVRLYITEGSIFSTLEFVGVSEFEIYGENVPEWEEYGEVSDDEIASAPGQYIQYSAELTTANPFDTSEVEEVSVCGANYEPDESYEFTPVDSGTDGTEWQSLHAEETVPEDTAITWLVRAGNTDTPDADWSDWATTSYTLTGVNGRYLQYRADLSTANVAYTPTIDCVAVSYLDEEGEEHHGGGGMIINPIRKPFIVNPFDGKKLEGDFLARIAPPADFSADVPQVSERYVNLELDGGPDAYYMAISESANFFMVGLLPYAERASYTLSPGYGRKVIYVRFYTDQGVTSDTLIVPVDYVMADVEFETEEEIMQEEPSEILEQQAEETTEIAIESLANSEKTEVALPAVTLASNSLVINKNSEEAVLIDNAIAAVEEQLPTDSLEVSDLEKENTMELIIPESVENTMANKQTIATVKGFSWWWLLVLILPFAGWGYYVRSKRVAVKKK